MPVSLVFDAGSEDSYPETALEQSGARMPCSAFSPTGVLARSGRFLSTRSDVSRTPEASLVEVRSISTYSYRRATIGSTRVARRAGVQIAALVTAISTPQAAARVHGSAAPIPYK